MRASLLALLFIAAVAFGQTIYTTDIIPLPASMAPSMDSNSAAVGSATQYARADHTHPSSVRKTTITIAGGQGKATWTFPVAYGAGIVPICLATVISTSNATVPYVVNLAGVPTNTAVTVVTFKSQATLASLLSSLFIAAENSVQVNLLCTVP